MGNNIIKYIDKKEAWLKSRECLSKKDIEENKLVLAKRDGDQAILSLDTEIAKSNNDNPKISAFLMLEYPGGATAVLCGSMEDFYFHYEQLFSEICKI